MAPHRRRHALTLVVAGVLYSGCRRQVASLFQQEQSAVALTGGPNTSMVYLARTTEGIIVIDLGWWGSRKVVRTALRELGASPAQVTDVFLTHSHRDHIGSWRLVGHSRFHVAEAERSLLFGEKPFRAWIPRWAERLKPRDVPKPNEIDVRAFSGDTAFAFGLDTLRAFVVPGHTAGSTVYLFRGVLFLGDAATYTPWGGFGSARRGYSDDHRTAAVSLAGLWAHIPDGAVRTVCTAHAHCRPYTFDLAEQLHGGRGPRP